MGFSFSGLSLPTAAAADLAAGGAVQQGAGPARHGSKPFFSGSKAAHEKKGDSTDNSESGLPLAALHAFAHTRPSQQKDTPPPASLFSSLWTSAVGASEPGSSSADADSNPIPESAALLSVPTASQGRSLAGLVPNVEAIAAAAGKSPALSLLAGGTGAVKTGNPDALSRMRDAGLLRQYLPNAAAAETVANDTGGASKAIKAALDSLTPNTAAKPEPTEEDSDNATPLAEQALDIADAGRSPSAVGPEVSTGQPQAQSTEDAPQPSESHPGVAVSGQALVDLVRPATDSKTSGVENEPRAPGKQATAAARQVAKDSIANPFAAAAPTPNSAPPNAVAAPPAQRPAAPHSEAQPHAETSPATPHGSLELVGADASAQATSPTPPSEIAFQAEIRLQGGQDASDAQPADSQPVVLSRQTAPVPREFVPLNTADPAPQPAEPAAKSAETIPAVGFRKADDQPDAGSSSLGQDHARGNLEQALDRGTQQAPPFAHSSSGMAPRAAVESAPLPKPAATPTAMQLDSATPPAPPDAGQAARSVTVRIQSEDNGTANVVFTDRGGEVQVTVRSSDAALTHSLRSDLGSLSGGLQQHGFDVKLWNAPPSSPSNAATRTHSAELSGQEDSGSPAHHHRHSPDDADPRNRRRGEWTEEFD